MMKEDDAEIMNMMKGRDADGNHPEENFADSDDESMEKQIKHQIDKIMTVEKEVIRQRLDDLKSQVIGKIDGIEMKSQEYATKKFDYLQMELSS